MHVDFSHKGGWGVWLALTYGQNQKHSANIKQMLPAPSTNWFGKIDPHTDTLRPFDWSRDREDSLLLVMQWNTDDFESSKALFESACELAGDGRIGLVCPTGTLVLLNDGRSAYPDDPTILEMKAHLHLTSH